MKTREILGVFIYSFLIALTIAVIVLACSKPAHGTATQPRPNSLGVEEIYQNPYTYLFALPVSGVLLADGNFTNMRFQPYAAAAMFDESILFCGDVSEFFNGKVNGPVVLTYRTQASRMLEGIGCHDLVSVFQVQTPGGINNDK
jgi:hypothetical protein